MVFLMTGRPLVPKAHTMAAEDVYAPRDADAARYRPTVRFRRLPPSTRSLAPLAMDPHHRCTVVRRGGCWESLASLSGAAAARPCRSPATMPTMVPPTDMPPTESPGPGRRDPGMTAQTQDTSAEDGTIASPPGRRRRGCSCSSRASSAQSRPGTFARAWHSMSAGRGGEVEPRHHDARSAQRGARSDMRVACPEAKGGRWRSKPSWIRMGRPMGSSGQSTDAGLVCRAGNGGASAGSRLKSPYRVRLGSDHSCRSPRRSRPRFVLRVRPRTISRLRSLLPLRRATGDRRAIAEPNCELYTYPARVDLAPGGTFTTRRDAKARESTRLVQG